MALAAVVALSIWDHPGSDYRHSDFFQFWAAPRLLLEGRDPYSAPDWASIYQREATAPVATPPPPERHVYPPWSAVVLLPLAAMPFRLAAAIWLVAQLSVVIAALRALSAAYIARREERVLLFGLAAAFQPLWLIVDGGNITGFLLGLFTFAIVGTLARSPLAGVPIGLLAVKPHPFAIAVPALVAISGTRRMLVGGGALTFAALVALAVPFGPGLIGEWIAAALDLQATTGSNATVWTLDRVLPGGSGTAVTTAIAAIGAFLLWWRIRRPAPAILAAGSVAISLFVAPHGWSYDGTLLLITLAAILGRAGSAAGARRAALLVVIAAVATLLPWTLYVVAFARGGEEWSALTPVAFFALLAVTSPRVETARPRP